MKRLVIALAVGVLVFAGPSVVIDLWGYLHSGDAAASRDSSGNYTRPAGNPVVTGTSISSTWANTLTSDLATEVTDSLSRSGKGGMLAALRGIDGTQAAPAFSWTSETGTGLFRNASNDIRLSIGGSSKVFWSATGEGIGVAPSWPFQVQGATASATQARFGASGDSPIGVYSHAIGPNLNANATNDGSTGWKYATSNATLALVQEMGANGWVFYTAPSGTAGNAITFTERARVSTSGVTIGASGTAISQSIRGTATLNPGASMAANTCAAVAVTVTGATTGADCAVGGSSFVTTGAYTVLNCAVNSSNTCTVTICNPTTTTITTSSFTASCRVFNP